MRIISYEKNILLYFIGVLILCSCNLIKEEKANKSIVDIGKEIPPKELLLLDSISFFLGLPESITLIDDKLFINDFFGKDGFIQSYDLSTNRVLPSFAVRGNGPNEFLSVANIDFYYRNDSLLIGVFDVDYRRYKEYFHENLSTPIINKRVPIVYTINEVHKIEKGYIATGIFPEGKYALLDDSLNVLKFTGQYRANKNTTELDLINATANLGTSAISESKDFLINIIFKAGVLEAYQLEKDSIFKVWEYIIEDLNYSVVNANIYNATVEGFIAAKVTNENIFALYSGEIDEAYKTAIYGQSILKFDYKGNLLDFFHLGRESIDFVIKEDKIYSLTHTPEPTILVYELPKK